MNGPLYIFVIKRCSKSRSQLSKHIFLIISSTIIFLFQPADHFLITVFHCISRHGEPGPGGPKFDVRIDVPAGSFPFYKVKTILRALLFSVVPFQILVRLGLPKYLLLSKANHVLLKLFYLYVNKILL